MLRLLQLVVQVAIVTKMMLVSPGDCCLHKYELPLITLTVWLVQGLVR